MVASNQGASGLALILMVRCVMGKLGRMKPISWNPCVTESAQERQYVIQVSWGVWHSVVAHENTILEAKDGKYETLSEEMVMKR